MMLVLPRPTDDFFVPQVQYDELGNDTFDGLGTCPASCIPTEAPTASPTEAPTASPTEAPTASPTEAPTTGSPAASPKRKNNMISRSNKASTGGPTTGRSKKSKPSGQGTSRDTEALSPVKL